MFDTVISMPMTIWQFLMCVITALVLGVLASLVFSVRRQQTNSLASAIALLPAVVTVVIMMVNGNIGAGLAVAGTFALVRFRSAPGSARDITGLFFAVAIGLSCGMGYLAVAAVFFVIFSAAVLLLTFTGFGENSAARQLKITIPENLDYDNLFDDILEKYTTSYELIRVRTTNMGTLFELTYTVILREKSISKQFIDELRCRNGNLNVICSREVEKDML
jgi:type III secretory pathway component EscS